MSSPAVEAVSHLNPDQVTADLNAVADYANKIPASNGKLFVAGFCWGGGQSFRFATHRADLAAAFVFYGPPPAKEAMANITAPVYGFYAGNDARIGATLPDAREQMKAAGKTFEPVTYEGAGHGFMRAGEAPDASDANRRARDRSLGALEEDPGGRPIGAADVNAGVARPVLRSAARSRWARKSRGPQQVRAALLRFKDGSNRVQQEVRAWRHQESGQVRSGGFSCWQAGR